MGLIQQAIRGLKQNLGNFKRGLGKQLGFNKKKKRKGIEETRIPRSWSKPGGKPEKPQLVIKYKRRIPGLKLVHRILAGVLLLINFSFSQFLLGSVGAQAQAMFILFLLNSYFLLRYLWKTREEKD